MTAYRIFRGEHGGEQVEHFKFQGLLQHGKWSCHCRDLKKKIIEDAQDNCLPS